MNMRHLMSPSARTRRVRRPYHNGHTADGGHAELETLTAAQSRRSHDLHFGQLVVEVADTVNGVRAQMDAAPEFSDPEFGSARDQANLSTVAAAADLPAIPEGDHQSGVRTTGVPPLTPEQLRGRYLAAVGALRDDARDALGWLLRGPVATSGLLPLALRRTLLRIGGIKLGALVYGLVRCYFVSSNVSIGTAAFVNTGCLFEGAGRIEIGNDCMLGPQVTILTSTHPVSLDGQIGREPETRDVRIEDGCWICARATILPGVRIGAGAIVAAGAVVTSDCDAGGLYAGVPARRVR
jgi:maltose O-acetyltransferase